MQAVRNLVKVGRLPALVGDQPRNKRSTIPLWAVRGLAKSRRSEPTDSRDGGPPPDAPAPPSARHTREGRGGDSAGGAEVEELRQRVSRLEAENSDLRFAWAAMRESRRLLGEADRDRESALKHLRKAERRQSQAAEKTARAELLQSDALSIYVMPADGSGA